MMLSLRPATAQDLPAVLALYAQPDMDDGRVLPIEQALALLSEFSRYPSYTLYVACEAEPPAAVVGSFALLVMHNLGHCGAPSAVVEDVVVRRDWQRRGVGRQMMQQAMALARAAGCYKLVLSSNQRRAPAHAFYESLGFKRHGLSFLVDL